MTRDGAMRRQQRPLAVGGACLLGGVLLCLAAPISEARAQSPLPDASSASVPPKVPVAAPLSGTLDVEGTLKVNTGLPAGTQVSINAFASVSNRTFTDTDDVGRSASVTVSGGQVVFKLLMPYTWPGVATSDPVNVNVTVFAIIGKGAISLSYQSFLTRKVPLPKNGVTTKVIFTGSL